MLPKTKFHTLCLRGKNASTNVMYMLIIQCHAKILCFFIAPLILLAFRKLGKSIKTY